MPWYTSADWWSAIGQWVGGIGTIAAVWIAMRQIRETRKLQYDLMKPELEFDGRLDFDTDSYVITATNLKATPVPMRSLRMWIAEGMQERREVFEISPFSLKTGEFYDVKLGSEYWSQDWSQEPVLLKIEFDVVHYSICVCLLVSKREYLSDRQVHRLKKNKPRWDRDEPAIYQAINYREEHMWFLLGKEKTLLPLFKKVKRRYIVAQIIKQLRKRLMAIIIKQLQKRLTKDQKESPNKENHPA